MSRAIRWIRSLSVSMRRGRLNSGRSTVGRLSPQKIPHTVTLSYLQPSRPTTRPVRCPSDFLERNNPWLGRSVAIDGNRLDLSSRVWTLTPTPTPTTPKSVWYRPHQTPNYQQEQKQDKTKMIRQQSYSLILLVLAVAIMSETIEFA